MQDFARFPPCSYLQHFSLPKPAQVHQGAVSICPWSHPISVCTRPEEPHEELDTHGSSKIHYVLTCCVRCTYFADKIRDMLHMCDFTSLAIVQAGGLSLQTFHTIFHLEGNTFFFYNNRGSHCMLFSNETKGGKFDK